ncbi:MAG TPA: hypothetical protein VN706_00950 [Gemmatimonadaceae bacterium]|nr:hypothetical protein [Gemmatimonadaceae bacterium]
MRGRFRVFGWSASVAPLLAVAGGGAIVLGAWLPWMSYFAGLVPLRGVIGINGRLLLGAGTITLLLAVVMALSAKPRVRAFARRSTGVLGVGVAVAAVWLLIGVRELTRVHTSNAMLAPRAGIGLAVVFAGGVVLAFAALVPDRRAMRGLTTTSGPVGRAE